MLYDEFDVDITPRSVFNYLQRSGWSRKVVKQKAAQRSALLRALWLSKSAYWSVDDLVFVDESAANKKTGWRKRGWSPRGQDCSILQSLKRSERWSVLPALAVTGYLPDPLIVQGSITKELFTWWLLHRVLPQLRPGQIIVMDNASIHHNLGLEEALVAYGVRIEYLPPYSPDFNPIEMTFHTLKL